MTASLSRKASAGLLSLGMAATVGGALAFEHIGGYIPCALCLLQRDPYYYGIPVAVAALLSTLFGGAGMGIYHAGVEWGFWEGPATCATTAQGVTQNAGDLLSDLNAKHGPSCTEASFRLLGLSFAGWNVIASLILAAIAFSGVRSAKA